jgi:hypothetical protein
MLHNEKHALAYSKSSFPRYVPGAKSAVPESRNIWYTCTQDAEISLVNPCNTLTALPYQMWIRYTFSSATNKTSVRTNSTFSKYQRAEIEVIFEMAIYLCFLSFTSRALLLESRAGRRWILSDIVGGVFMVGNKLI